MQLRVASRRAECRGVGIRIGLVMVALGSVVAWNAPAARAAVSLGAWVQHSPDDISGFTSLTGDNNIANVTLPFTFVVEGTNYTTIAVSTNGWIEFGTNTAGDSDPTNDCLPTSAHTNPLLAAYWDDLNPFGTAIRYGSVGSSPNRTFIIDYEVDLTSGTEGQDDLRFQVQLHERSNLINVRFRDTQNAANGQSATMGFQGAGGGSATTVQGLSCNGKVLDDNRPDEGWSADVGRAGLVTMAAFTAHSPDDIIGFTTLSGDNAIAGVTMPFSVTIEGTSYTQITIGTNGTVQFGTTTGSNPSANTGLPSASFPGPTVFYYWDDLQTEGNNVRYGTVGSSPNRVFIVDFQENLVASSGDKVNGQLLIHERSNLINVKYRSTLSTNANGQSATIGFQGAGGASAVAYPLSFNGKVLDDDRPDSGWSIHPKTQGAMSLHSLFMESSPNDISGFTTLSGDNAIAGVTMPFSITLDGTSYTTLTIGTNGIIQFGTLSGANPTSNASLPSSSFTGPTVFYYWDDLNPEGGNIRYGTVGSSPHRTFIVDFQENTVADSGDKVNGQVQIHEGSSTINVQYRSTLSADSNGQSATIGFQTAGGASGTGYPLTFNGKILDDNIPNAGWSVAPLPVCGNGITETKESCDAGVNNGTAGSCCSSTCSFKANLTACTDDGNDCTNDQCNGASATCQHPAKSSGTACGSGSDTLCDNPDTCNGSGTCQSNPEPGTTTCRVDAGECDVAENCDGAGSCPADGFEPSGTACGSPSDTDCDNPDTCNGGGACQANLEPNTTTCRSDAGDCDVAESCDGAGNCPADGFEPSGTACGSPSDTVCDNPDTCNSSGGCLTNPEPSTTECRADAGECDVADNCDGAGSCSPDAFEPSGTACGDPSDTVCDNADTCDGSGTCATNPEPVTTECRADAGECDVADNCDGAGDCSPDAFEASGTACGDPADTDCDNADTCDGSGNCDVNNEANTVVCRAASSGQLCDAVEICDGSGNCPADGVLASGTVCRSDAGECDVEEQCDGSSSACPADVFEPSGTACGDPSDTDCTNPDTCDGSGTCDLHDEALGFACGDPSDTDCTNPDTCDGAGTCDPNQEPITTICRPGVDACDVTENCDGAGACPADGFEPSGTFCGDPSDTDCTNPDTCDGSGSCIVNDELSGTACGDSSDTDCTNPDTCDGAGTCDANHEAATVVCRAVSSGQLCDAVENCDGAGNCPTDGVLSAGTECRASAGECDTAEDCDGSSSACPTDTQTAAGTACTSDGNVCTDDECDGLGACQHPAGNAGTICRGDAGACDVAETCDGSSTSCPADGFEADGTGCSDGQFCTGTDTCQSGTCVSPGSPCAMGETCDEINDGCFNGNCPSTPGTCETAQKTLLLIGKRTDDATKNKLIFKWIKGAAAQQSDFADPTTSADYAFCLYAGGSLLTQATVPPSPTSWKPISDKGYKYKDTNGAEDGIKKVLVKGTGVAGKSKALIKGKGANLPFGPITLPLNTTPVVAQLRNNATGFCVQGTYTTPIRSTDKLYKAKQ